MVAADPRAGLLLRRNYAKRVGHGKWAYELIGLGIPGRVRVLTTHVDNIVVFTDVQQGTVRGRTGIIVGRPP